MHSVLYKKNKIWQVIYNITKKWWDSKPQFLSDPMSDRKKKVFANSVIPNVWYNSYLRFYLKSIDQCLILFLNYIIFIVFTPFIHFRFQPNPFVKTITTRLVIWEIHDFADGYCLRNPWLCWWIWSEKSILKKQINDSKYLSLPSMTEIRMNN